MSFVASRSWLHPLSDEIDEIQRLTKSETHSSKFRVRSTSRRVPSFESARWSGGDESGSFDGEGGGRRVAGGVDALLRDLTMRVERDDRSGRSKMVGWE